MSLKIIPSFTLLTFILLLSSHHAFAQKIGLVRVQFTSNQTGGSVYIKVIAKGADFPDTPADKAAFNSIYNDIADKKIFSLPIGEYAISAFYDTNHNGELDKNLLGIPTEPYGFSNNARGSFGPAKFEDAAFTIHADETTDLIINLE